AALLHDRQWEALDREHLIEELHLMAGTERRALGSQLERLLLHLLKWQYQPRRRLLGHSWEDSIVDARARLRDLLEDQPSLERFAGPRAPPGITPTPAAKRPGRPGCRSPPSPRPAPGRPCRSKTMTSGPARPWARNDGRDLHHCRGGTALRCRTAYASAGHP